MIRRFPFRVFATALIAAGGGRRADGAEVVAPALGAGCAGKRALERHTPCLRALRVIGCNLLEIRVTSTGTPRIRLFPFFEKTTKPTPFPSKTNPQTPQKNTKT
jgi:hypothetical protein